MRVLVETFGAARIVWGSDFPYVTLECGYDKSAAIVKECGANLTDEQLELVMGGNLGRMFPGGWGDDAS